MIDRSLLTAVFIILHSAGTSIYAQDQLFSLTNQAPASRFPVTGIVWAQNSGESSICLWADDKLSAMSFTVDDNHYQDVAWWMETADRYGFKVTWFLITDRITKGENPSVNATWAKWRDLYEQGHDIQSHTAWHLHTELPEWSGIDDEYRIAKEQIETNIPGHKCEFMAYPGGTNTYLNNRTNAAKYYAGNRAGGGFNRPDIIDYFSIRYFGWPAGDPTTNTASANPNSLFNSNYPNYYRGWAVYLTHQITDRNAMTNLLGFVDRNRTNLWLGLFADVAKYGQERDTASLVTNEISATRIALTLNDRMLDSRFDYPLTIKVRLPETWEGVQAVQGGTAVVSRVVEHAGALYALVKAVPDRGEISLLPSAAADSDNDGIPDRWERQHFGGETNADPSAMAANGINTVREMYIAGLDPVDAQARFICSGRPDLSGRSFEWNAVSGRVYSVYWTTNLLAGFQPLETNIIWPQNHWTDMMHEVLNDGFYQLRVRLQQEAK